MNHTSNYQLSQWNKDDRIMMEDFNRDNARIDSAIAAEVSARKSAIAGVRQEAAAESAGRDQEVQAIQTTLTKKGNCKIYTATYQGDGSYGQQQPSSLTFPKKPVLFCVMPEGYGYGFWCAPGTTVAYLIGATSGTSVTTAWSGSTVSWYGNSAEKQLNENGKTYHVTALLALE